MIVYVSIGNSDDKLIQKRWSAFVYDVHDLLEANGKLHGAWLSSPHSEYQNACWCVELVQPMVEKTKKTLIGLAKRYEQDSIAWAEAPVTRFLGQPEDD